MAHFHQTLKNEKKLIVHPNQALVPDDKPLEPEVDQLKEKIKDTIKIKTKVTVKIKHKEEKGKHIVVDVKIILTLKYKYYLKICKN